MYPNHRAAMSIDELHRKYFNTSYNDPMITFESSTGQCYLRFARNISIETAKTYANDLARSSLLFKILEFVVNGQLSQADLDFFLARSTHFFYILDWPQETGSWINQWATEGRSYPLVVRIVFNNLKWVFTRDQLPALKAVFPNLISVEYVDHDYDTEDEPLVSPGDLEETLTGIKLMPYDN